MTQQELQNLLNTLLAFSTLVIEQYQKYQEENNLTDEQMRDHLKEMNLEDDTKLHQLIQLAKV